MADQSTYNTIKRRIEKSKRGTLFFPDTFADYGTSDAIRSALVRLCENEMLTRVAQGIYCYPRIDTRWGGGVILPSIEEIAEAIAKDQPRAKDFSDYQGDDGQYTSLQIENNGEIIYIGLQRDKAGGGFFFIQGKEKAFK